MNESTAILLMTLQLGTPIPPNTYTPCGLGYLQCQQFMCMCTCTHICSVSSSCVHMYTHICSVSRSCAHMYTYLQCQQFMCTHVHCICSVSSSCAHTYTYLQCQQIMCAHLQCQQFTCAHVRISSLCAHMYTSAVSAVHVCTCTYQQCQQFMYTRICSVGSSCVHMYTRMYLLCLLGMTGDHPKARKIVMTSPPQEHLYRPGPPSHALATVGEHKSHRNTSIGQDHHHMP